MTPEELSEQRRVAMAEAALEHGCPKCYADAGEACREPNGRARPERPHKRRLALAEESAPEAVSAPTSGAAPSLRIPLARTDNRARRYFELRLTPTQALGLRALADGLAGEAVTASGKIVKDQTSALRWLLEQFAARVADLAEGEVVEVDAVVDAT